MLEFNTHSIESTLFKAISEHQKKKIGELLSTAGDKQTLLNCRVKNGFTPFLFAVFLGNIEVVDLLVAHGSKPTETQENTKYSALHLAAITGNIAMYDHLCATYQLNGKEESMGVMAPILLALCKNHMKLVKHILDHYYTDSQERKNIGQKLSFLSVIKRIKETLSLSPNNTLSIEDAKHLALIANSSPNIFNFFMNALKIHPGTLSNEDRPLIYYAALGNCWNAFDYFLKTHYTDQAVYRTVLFDCLIHLAEQNNSLAFDYICKNFIQDEILKSKLIMAVFSYVISKGLKNFFSHLRTWGDSIKDIKDPSAIYLAIKSGDSEMVDLVVATLNTNGASKEESGFNQKDANGRIATHWAAEDGHQDLFDHLIDKYKLKPHDVDRDGNTPAVLAFKNNHFQLFSHIMEAHKTRARRQRQNLEDAILSATENEGLVKFNYLAVNHSIDFKELRTKLKGGKIGELVHLRLKISGIIKKHDFSQLRICLEAMTDEQKNMVLNWNDRGKKPVAACIKKLTQFEDFALINCLTLLFEQGADLTDISQRDIQTYPFLALAIVRAMRTRVFDIANPFAEISKNPELLALLIKSSQIFGPYQALDRQLLIDGLMNRSLFASSPSLRAIHPLREKVSLSPDEQKVTLEILLMSLVENASYFPENLDITRRRLEEFCTGGLSNHLSSETTPWGMVLAGCQYLKDKLHHATQENKKLIIENQTLKEQLDISKEHDLPSPVTEKRKCILRFSEGGNKARLLPAMAEEIAELSYPSRTCRTS